MRARTYVFVTATIFGLVGLLHLLRVVLGWEAVIGGWSVPMWVSWVAVVVTAALAGLGVTLGRRTR